MSAKGLKRGKTCELRVVGLRFIFYLIGRGEDASFPNLLKKENLTAKPMQYQTTFLHLIW